MKAFVIFFALLCTVTGFAQTDSLSGRWEGEINSMQGKRPTTVIFTAAGTLPWAKPVQEIVMPEVGSSAVSSSASRAGG